MSAYSKSNHLNAFIRFMNASPDDVVVTVVVAAPFKLARITSADPAGSDRRYLAASFCEQKSEDYGSPGGFMRQLDAR